MIGHQFVIYCLFLYSKNVSVEGQTDTNPAFIVTNIGAVGRCGVTGWLTINTQTGFNFKCGPNNTPVGSVILNTTHQTLYTGIVNPDDYVNIWCWCDFDNPTTYYDGDIDFELV